MIFFFNTIQRKTEALSLPPEIQSIVLDKLIPALYIRQASKKAAIADSRHRLQIKSEEMLASFGSMPLLSSITEEELAVIETVAEECATLFQRSSSCVEGRNGQLSLRHHSLHHLSNRKLAALIATHNYFIKRDDGTMPIQLAQVRLVPLDLAISVRFRKSPCRLAISLARLFLVYCRNLPLARIAG